MRVNLCRLVHERTALIGFLFLIQIQTQQQSSFHLPIHWITVPRCITHYLRVIAEQTTVREKIEFNLLALLQQRLYKDKKAIEKKGQEKEMLMDNRRKQKE